ncbi:MAG: TrmH family RNA methyltransferase, partial [Bacilli bacterium]
MRQYKKNDPLSYALGMTLTFELIKYHPEQIRDVYFHSKLRENEHTDRLVKTLSTLGISIQVQDKIFNVLSPKNNCFVIASFAKYETTLDVTASHLVLVEPENAGNLGTIIRTALGFGICNMVLIGNHVDPFDPKTIRASMGAIFGVHCTSFDTFSNYQAHALNHHYYPFMLQSNHLLGNEPIQA